MSDLLGKLKKPRRSKKVALAEPLLAEAEPVSAQPLGTELVVAEDEPVSTQLPSERVRGTVKWFSRSRGYGFIEPANGPDVFVHHSAIQGEGHHRTLAAGQRVEFSIRPGDHGPEAAEVRTA